MRICNCNFYQSALLPVFQAISDVKSRVERVAQFIFSKIAFLGQCLPALSIKNCILISAGLIASTTLYLTCSPKTILKISLLILFLFIVIEEIFSKKQRKGNSKEFDEEYESYCKMWDQQRDDIKKIRLAYCKLSEDTRSQLESDVEALKLSANKLRENNGDLKETLEKRLELKRTLKFAEKMSPDDRLNPLLGEFKDYPELPPENGPVTLQELRDVKKRRMEHHVKVMQAFADLIKDDNALLSELKTLKEGEKITL